MFLSKNEMSAVLVIKIAITIFSNIDIILNIVDLIFNGMKNKNLILIKIK